MKSPRCTRSCIAYVVLFTPHQDAAFPAVCAAYPHRPDTLAGNICIGPDETWPRDCAERMRAETGRACGDIHTQCADYEPWTVADNLTDPYGNDACTQPDGIGPRCDSCTRLPRRRALDH
jgi:hypothetical protein